MLTGLFAGGIVLGARLRLGASSRGPGKRHERGRRHKGRWQVWCECCDETRQAASMCRRCSSPEPCHARRNKGRGTRHRRSLPVPSSSRRPSLSSACLLVAFVSCPDLAL